MHTNVWGPAPTTSCQERKYFITFTDGATWYTTIFLLHIKDEALEAYKFYKAWATTQLHWKAIKVLHSDREGEYLSKVFNEHLAKVGMGRKLMPHDTPELNGVAKHLNCTLLKQICTFMHATDLPKLLWGEALRHATWLKNWIATRSLNGQMLFQALYSQAPDLSALCMWGLPILVHSTDGSRLHAHMCEARWLRLNVDARAHCVYWSGSGNITVEWNIYFETSAQLEGEEEESSVEGNEQNTIPQNDSPSVSLNISDPPMPAGTQTS